MLYTIWKVIHRAYNVNYKKSRCEIEDLISELKANQDKVLELQCNEAVQQKIIKKLECEIADMQDQLEDQLAQNSKLEKK